MPSDQLFLFGYSQGGHATMAAVREIENNPLRSITGLHLLQWLVHTDMSGVQRELMELR